MRVIILLLPFLSRGLLPLQAADIIHDPVGRLTRVETADGTTIDYQLDANGNTLNRTVIEKFLESGKVLRVTRAEIGPKISQSSQSAVAHSDQPPPRELELGALREKK